MTTFGEHRDERPDDGRDPQPAAPRDARSAGPERGEALDVGDPFEADDGIGSVVHQPACEDDLVQHPPRDAACAAIRARLRDRVDGDLTLDAAEAIDDHVHRCRDCGLALARMELEVLRIRRALEPEQSAARAVPVAFTASVMRAVGDVVLQDRTVPEPVQTRVTPPDFTRNVMDRVRLEWRRMPWWERTASRIGVTGLATVAAGAAALLVLALVWSFEPVGAPQAGLLVLSARDAAVWRVDELASLGAEPAGAGGRSLRVGHTVRPGSAILTGIDGGFVGTLLEAPEDARSAGPADPLTADAIGQSQVRLGAGAELIYGDDGGLALRRGSLTHAAGRRSPVAVGADAAPPRPERGIARSSGRPGTGAVVHVLPDGDEPGLASIQVTPLHREDLPRDAWKVRVEVLGGRVEIHDSMRDPHQVVRGQVAYFDNLGGWQVDLSPDQVLASLRQEVEGRPLVGDGAAQRDGYFEGRLVRADTGQPVGGGRIEILTADDVERSWRGCAPDGTFHFLGDRLARRPNDRPPVLVRGWPSRNSVDLAPSRPLLVDLGQLVSEGAVLEIELPTDRPLSGIVFDAAGRRASGVRVTPLWFDELFGSVERMPALGADTDADGRFVLRGLPPQTEPHVTLALLVVGPEHPPTILRPDGAPAGDLGLEVTLSGPRQVKLDGLPPGSLCEIVESIPGAPMMALSVLHLVASDAEGRADLGAVGSGVLHLLQRSAEQAVRLVADESTGRHVPAGDARSFAITGMISIGGDTVGSERRSIVLRAGRRIQRIAPADTLVRSVVTVLDGRSGSPRDAHVFARLADGRIELVGRQHAFSQARYSVPAERPLTVFAIGDAGEFGLEAVGDGVSTVPPIEVERTGSIDLSATLPEGGRVVLEARDGPLAGRILWRRVPAGRGTIDGLVPGLYRVGFGDDRFRDIRVVAGRSSRAEPVRPRAVEGR